MKARKMIEPRFDFAKAKAQQTLDELDVSCIEQLRDLEALCRGRGVHVTYQPMKNFDGVLIRDRRLIAVRSSILDLGRRRFTAAHELGHWEMHPGLDQLYACTAGDVVAYRGSAHELEANTFAAELLMPEAFLTAQLRFASPTLQTVKKLAAHFQTSLTAAAVRLVEHTEMPVFVAFSSNQRLKWFRRSKKAKDYFFLRYGAELDGDSLARYSLNTPDEASDPVHVESTAWFPDDFNNHRFKVYEESVELGSFNTTMSIITVDD